MIRIQDFHKHLFSGRVLGASKMQLESMGVRYDTGSGDCLSGCNARIEKVVYSLPREDCGETKMLAFEFFN